MAQQFEGKSVEEALTAASESLGVQRDQLTYHVVQEKRGFLGGVKSVVLEAEVNQAAIAPPASLPPADAPRAAQQRAAGPRRAGGGGEGRRNDRGGRSRGGRGRGARRRPERDEDTFQTGDFERFAGEIPTQAEESEQAATVRAWYARVIELTKLSLEIRTEENETQIIVRLYGGDAPRLVDEHGELLDALQVLGNKALTGRKVEKEIELDCAGFKAQRNEALAERARNIAERVRHDKREQLLPAMTPIERRIVHLALQDDADVTTESRGDGFYKRVAIVPREHA
jgi:spoIIIJ-associated protein